MTLINRIGVDPRALFAGRIRTITFTIGVIYLVNLPGPVRGQGWTLNGNVESTTGNVNIGPSSWPPPLFNVEGLSTFHFDDWGNDTVVFRGQKSVTYQYGEYAIRTFYGGLLFRNTQSNATMLLLGETGNVGIGTMSPGQCGGSNTQPCLLTVNGAIGAKEIIVTNGITADYVFKPDYRLKPLTEVASFIQEHHHLPEIPSEAEVRENGISVGDMQVKLLAKVEELTLHMIQAEERNNRLEQQNLDLRARITSLEMRNGKNEADKEK